jgi:hypothetical protein
MDPDCKEPPDLAKIFCGWQVLASYLGEKSRNPLWGAGLLRALANHAIIRCYNYNNDIQFAK